MWSCFELVLRKSFGTKETFHNSAAWARNISFSICKQSISIRTQTRRKTFYLQLSWQLFQSILKQKTLTLCAGLLLFCIIYDRRSNIWGFEILVRQNPRYSCTFFSLNNEVIKKHSLVGLQHKRSSCTITAQRLWVATFYSVSSLQLSCIHVLCLLSFRLWIKNKRWRTFFHDQRKI